MAKHHIVHAAVASGLTLFILPALAEEDQGLTVTLGVEQKFEAGDNLALERPEEGNTVLSTTDLSLGLLSETHNQTFSLSAGVKIRDGSLPSNSDLDTGIVEPILSFSYKRESSNAAFTFDGSYRESDISFTPAVSDFAGDDGIIILPPDFEDLEGSGTRQIYRLSTELETGKNAPLGFVFGASVSGISYDNQSPTLEDTFRYSASARANLRLSDVTTGFLSYEIDHFESDDIQDTERDTHSFEVGVIQDVSPLTTIEAAIGYTEIDESVLFGLPGDSSGATGRLSLTHQRPNGEVTASYATSQDQDGARHNVQVGRSFELPRGSFSAMVGATKKGSSSPELIGSLNYNQELPTGNLRVGINRDVSVSDEDNERIATTAQVNYRHDINNISHLGVDFSFGKTEGTATTVGTTRADISASYNRDITEDWSLSTGVSYRVRDQQGASQTDSTSIFLTLRREFTLFR